MKAARYTVPSTISEATSSDVTTSNSTVRWGLLHERWFCPERSRDGATELDSPEGRATSTSAPPASVTSVRLAQLIRIAGRMVLVVGCCALAALLVAAGASGARHHHRPGAQPAPSLFGINTGTYDNNYARFVRDMPTAKRIGARWIHLTGANIKFPHGRLSFAQMDSQVNRARQMGLGVLMSLGGIRGACSVRPAPSDVTTCPPTSSRDLHAYGSYLRRLLRHFRGRVDHYESWVEPNHASFWPPKPDPAAYARLLEAEYRVFRAVNPHDKLIFAGLGGTAFPYLDQALSALHGRRAFDLVGDHPYRFAPKYPDALTYASFPDGHARRLDWVGELDTYEQEFTDHGYGRPPMWLTEFGWPGTSSGPNDGYHPTEQAQADALRRAYQLLLGDPRVSFVQAAFWFNLRDYAPRLANPDPEFFGHYGLLHNTFSPKPAAALFTYFAHGGR